MPDDNDIDAGWDSEPESQPEPEPSEPTPTPDVDALDEGWDAPRRHRTGAERAAARKQKARDRAQRQRNRAAEAASKQKPRRPRAPKRERGAERDAPERPLGRAVLAFSPRRTKRSWARMLVAVALIVAVAAFVLFVLER